MTSAPLPALLHRRVVRPDVGRRIRWYREKGRMRQKDLAHRAGVAPRAFSSAEHEGLVSVATAEKIADALGIPLTAIWPRETP